MVVTDQPDDESARFEQTAAALAEALDEFSDALEAVLADFEKGRKVLSTRTGIGLSYFSKWLAGRDQIFKEKGVRFPGVRDADTIITGIGGKNELPSARRLYAAAVRVDRCTGQLAQTRRTGWKSQAASCLRAREQAETELDSGAGQEADSETPQQEQSPPSEGVPASEPGQADDEVATSDEEPPAPVALEQPETPVRRQFFRRPLFVTLAVAVGLVFVGVTALWQRAGAVDGPGNAPATILTPSPDGAVPPLAPLAASDEECRNDWSVMASGSVEYQPCTALSEDGVVVSARVRPTDLVTDPVEVTVWLWLMEHDLELLVSGQGDLTRDASTLDSCRVTLGADDEVRECGPFVFQPPHEGRFSTSGNAALADGEYPPGWDSAGFTGTQGPAVLWPAAAEGA
ncbi:hypothetical protein [Nocardiopsis sp. TNDT3]|uniref:hypothetical protein n=1 Tax=Nocardiopsis sp. TNDT3 TaxID=2249354 RepID=UPI0013007A84|nr:hypothetical protein [Nocardiopsis sp. TNDT3]